MTQPADKTTPETTPPKRRRRTAAALASALDAAPPTAPTAPNPHQNPTADEPVAAQKPTETAAEAPKGPVSTEHPPDAESTPQEAAQGSEQAQQGEQRPEAEEAQTPKEDPPPTERPDPTDAEADTDGENSYEVIRPDKPPRLPNFAKIQQRKDAATKLDPAAMALYTRALEVALMQVSRSFTTMMRRQSELDKQVQMARDAGYPEVELQALAIKHNWDLSESDD